MDKEEDEKEEEKEKCQGSLLLMSCCGDWQ